MNYFLFCAFLTVINSQLLAQDTIRRLSLSEQKIEEKPPIDTSVYENWPSVGGLIISNNGKYAIYTIENRPVGSRTLMLQSTDNSWKKEVPYGPTAFSVKITSDSKNAIVIKGKDSLTIIPLGSSSIEYIAKVKSFQIPKNGSGKWVAYHSNEPGNILTLRNLSTGQETAFSNVKNYIFNNNGNTLILQREDASGGSHNQTLDWINLNEGKSMPIWHGSIAENMILDDEGEQLVFIVKEKNGSKIEKSVWYYALGMNKAILKTDNTSTKFQDSLEIDGISHWSGKDTKKLFLRLIRKNEPKMMQKPNQVGLTIWSYKDRKLQSQQTKEIGYKKREMAILDFKTNRIIRLEQETDRCVKTFEDFAIIHHRISEGDASEDNWNSSRRLLLYLISLENGAKREIEKLENREIEGNNISPKGKYLVFYEKQQKNFFSYEISTGILRNITNKISTSWLSTYADDYPTSSTNVRGVACWLEEDTALLIYDQYDIWKIDPKGIQPPINMTNGYGKRQKIIFSLIYNGYSDESILKDSSLILSAFNTKNKDNGFFRKRLSSTEDPVLLTMGPQLYYIPDNPYLPDGSNFRPIKALDSNIYIVRRMSATNSANYYSTTDFRTFKQLSDVKPERDYNWYKAELHKWESRNGETIQGILYKPEDFNPEKRYPVIFYCYERQSDRLNAYIKPTTSGNGLNIPFFVSNGYLVFTPDIHFSIGHPGESAINSILPAIQYLSRRPFIKENKIGFQGHSFGGFLGNYLATHTDNFAAICSSSGLSDFISGYNSIAEDGRSLQSLYELGQNRIGATLWDKPNLYLENSPVLSANKVSTPILMMHTTNDGICPLTNALEFFTALRRLRKKAWLLEYSDANHSVYGQKGIDFTERLKEFFDHYLKDKEAPKWME
ncbi:alpha/beta hydrolase family protein [Chitinophaga japonensis]|uniref:Dipeptidyl aminopeptidase/acylaminoacyl peptidase n=1 Tax=Chitinophaga japonensis TaxID=104662 RepID=A0A562T273_CHIJA|nr:prolyl oligopeptidase family serine peptidase [Chitinophaga japonensis]TWI87777.1 dipeptidyl aminopeptidase/acylaminoacyl peptidase [Chitinophaga japonensis]